MTKNIRIYLPESDGASYIAVTDDPVTIGLFGTNALPTPFTGITPAESVLAKLRELNPDAQVELAGVWISVLEEIPDEGRCLVCGCTDMRACDGGCSWVGPAVCSRCCVELPVVVDPPSAVCSGAEIELGLPW